MGRRKDLPPKAHGTGPKRCSKTPIYSDFTLYRTYTRALTFEHATDPRYTYEEAQTLLNAEEELNTSHHLIEKTDAIIVRFNDLQLTRARAEEQISVHNASIARQTFSKVQKCSV